MEELLKWTATVFLTVSALFVSFNIKWSTVWWAYIGFFVGHVTWAILSYYMHEWSLVILNIALALVDAYAIFIRFINKPIGDKNANNDI